MEHLAENILTFSVWKFELDDLYLLMKEKKIQFSVI